MIRDASRSIVPLEPEPQGSLAPVHYRAEWMGDLTARPVDFWVSPKGCGFRHPPGTPCPPVRLAAPGEIAGDPGIRSRSARKGALKLAVYKREAAATREATKARRRSRTEG